MTPRERVYCALQFHDSDIVPYNVTFTSPARARLAEYLRDPDFESRIGNHLALLSHRRSGPLEEIAPGHFRDEWGVVWNRTVDRDIGIVANRVLPNRSLDGLCVPDVQTFGIASEYPSFIDSNSERFRVTTLGFSLFERAWTLRGMDNLLVDMLEAPQFVHELLDIITDVNMAHLDIALSYDIDCVLFGDDWGSQRGLIMGPSLWREFIKPRVARFYKRVRTAGKYVAIHSCGDVKVLLPELADIGLNIFNPFQPETMDIFETKRRYYGRLSFYGGISVQTLLPLGTPDEIKLETRKLLRELGAGGGYIASPSHDIPADVPPENIAAMLEVLQSQ